MIERAKKNWPAAVLIALCLIVFLARLHTYREPLERDLTTYAVIAHEMLAGKALYRELWDHKPPAVHVTYAAAELIAGYGRDSIFLMNVAAALATLFVCYWAGTLTGGRVAGCFAAAFWAVTSGSLALEGNQPNTEVFMNIFLAAGFALLVRAGNKNLGTRGAFFAGVLFAIASFYKQVVVIQPALLAVAYVACCDHRFRKKACVDMVIIAATGVVMWALMLGYFFARGSGAAFVESVFSYNRYYSSSLSHQALHNFKGWMALSPDILIVVVPVAMLAAIGIFRGALAQERHWILLLVYLIASEIAVLLPGWPFPHYYQLLLPALAIGAGWSIESLRRALAPTFSSLPYATGAAVCAIVVVVQLPNYFASPEDWSVKKYGEVFVETEQLADKIDKLLARDETFYEWGSETGLYFTSGRRPVSGITFAFPMLGGPLKEKLSLRLVEDLKKAQPDLIVADVPTITLTGREHPVLVWFRGNYKAFARTDNFLLLARNGSRLADEAVAMRQNGELRTLGPQLSELK
jgi:4-amino-4-deoxy-L-arabinose transferase-like glycosyltransferase